MPRDEELPIIRAFYDFVLWLNPKIAKFPREQRFVLSHQLIPILGHAIKRPYFGARGQPLLGSLSWMLLRPMIDNPGQFGQTQG